MTNELKNIYKRFPSQVSCLIFLEGIRWNNVPICPICNHTKFSAIKSKRAYHCNLCNRTFSVTTKTLFHKSKLDLQKWFYVIDKMLNPEHKPTAREIGEEIKVAKDTAWSMQKKIKSQFLSDSTILFIISKNIHQ